MMPLQQYEKNVTSQWGEDGVLEEIFNRVGEGNKICVEFGAWDGKHMSNSWVLWHEKDWSAILIEGEEDRYLDLKKDLEVFPKATAVHRFVDIIGDNSLDSILDEMEVTDEIDLVSIDIDSDDYAIFKALKRNPRVMVIEYNPTVPPHIDLVQKEGNYIGASVSMMCKLAQKKGYRLVHLTYTNVIFLRNDLMEKIGFEELDYVKVFHWEELTYVINSYDGQALLSRPMPYSPYIEQADKGLKKLYRSKVSEEGRSPTPSPVRFKC